MDPRGIRNNNPGNIRYVLGITSTYARCTGQDEAGFCVFDTPEHGLEALARLLVRYQDKHGLKTIRGIINRWAPPVENETTAYVAAVAHSTGFAADTELNLHDAATLQVLVTAIVQHENGQQPYPAAMIAGVVADALGPSVSTYIPPPTVHPDWPAAPQPEKRMPIIGIIAALGPLISQLLPQVGKLFSSGSEVSQRNLAAAQLVVDTMVSATGAPNVQGAIEAMQADPKVHAAVTQAVVTQPDIMGILEVGDGVIGARAADEAIRTSDKPFWYSPAFWITMLVVVPPVDFMVFTVISKMAPPSEQLVTQVVTGLLGLIAVAAAFYYGTTYGSLRKTELAAQGKDSTG